jgi:hypothetical protein
MKLTSILLLLIAFSFSSYSQQWKLTGGYSLEIPKQEMSKNIQAANGLQAGVLYQLPGKLKRLSVGAELGVGTYASKRIDQTFQFDVNTSSIVPVNYNSNIFYSNFLARLNLLPDKSLVIPYIDLKGGLYNFFSNIYIDDPNDPNGCHALQNENIVNDKTFYWSAGGGIQINPAVFSNRKKNRNEVMIDIGANTIRGGKMDYINTKHLIDPQTINDPGGKPLSVQFINASTQEIHEHTVAQVYTSPLRLLEFRVGVTVTLGR